MVYAILYVALDSLDRLLATASLIFFVVHCIVLLSRINLQRLARHDIAALEVVPSFQFSDGYPVASSNGR